MGSGTVPKGSGKVPNALGTYEVGHLPGAGSLCFVYHSHCV